MESPNSQRRNGRPGAVGAPQKSTPAFRSIERRGGSLSADDTIPILSKASQRRGTGSAHGGFTLVR
jgi:hypothetical protein